ncbi:MAG: glycosyltransferase family 39 protein [Planctomycetota bacterium]
MNSDTSWPRLELAFALFGTLLWLGAALLPGYGLFIDEYYYAACAGRLDWGYVDHPPLAPAVLRGALELLGHSRLALRLPPALAGGVLVFLCGWMARRLGAGARGRALACAAALLPPGYHIMFGFFSMNAFELVLWAGVCALVIELARAPRPATWLALGGVLGLGLLNKHTMVLLAGALALGILATRARRTLATPWPWLAALLALLMLTPNLLWQHENGWPSLEFYANADRFKNVPTPPLEVALLQVLFLNPATALLWIAGLAALLFRREFAHLRHLGLAAALLFALILAAQKSRPDRIAGIYPLLFAAGAVTLEPWLATRARQLAAGALLVLGFLLCAPLGLPLLPPRLAARHAQALGAARPLEAGESKVTNLPQWFADRLGWEVFAQDVRAVLASLPPEERSQTAIFTQNYGTAGALEWHGVARDTLGVHTAHNSYFLWGPPAAPFATALVVGDEEDDLRELFHVVELARVSRSEEAMPERRALPLWLCRNPRVDLLERWEGWKHFE